MSLRDPPTRLPHLKSLQLDRHSVDFIFCLFIGRHPTHRYLSLGCKYFNLFLAAKAPRLLDRPSPSFYYYIFNLFNYRQNCIFLLIINY